MVESETKKDISIDKYRSFELFCDGCYDVESVGNCGTFAMGVTKINYDSNDNTLHVYLRRPGLLIGKGGSNIDKLRKYIESEIKIHEVKNLWDW